MAQQFWVKTSSRTQGPFSSQQIRSLASDGKLKPEHQISTDQKRWMKASSVKGLSFADSEMELIEADMIEPDSDPLFSGMDSLGDLLDESLGSFPEAAPQEDERPKGLDAAYAELQGYSKPGTQSTPREEVASVSPFKFFSEMMSSTWKGLRIETVIFTTVPPSVAIFLGVWVASDGNSPLCTGVTLGYVLGFALAIVVEQFCVAAFLPVLGVPYPKAKIAGDSATLASFSKLVVVFGCWVAGLCGGNPGAAVLCAPLLAILTVTVIYMEKLPMSGGKSFVMCILISIFFILSLPIAAVQAAKHR